MSRDVKANHEAKAKELREEYRKVTDDATKNQIANDIFYHEKKAEEARRLKAR